MVGDIAMIEANAEYSMQKKLNLLCGIRDDTHVKHLFQPISNGTVRRIFHASPRCVRLVLLDLTENY